MQKHYLKDDFGAEHYYCPQYYSPINNLRNIYLNPIYGREREVDLSASDHIILNGLAETIIKNYNNDSHLRTKGFGFYKYYLVNSDDFLSKVKIQLKWADSCAKQQLSRAFTKLSENGLISRQYVVMEGKKHLYVRLTIDALRNYYGIFYNYKLNEIANLLFYKNSKNYLNMMNNIEHIKKYMHDKEVDDKSLETLILHKDTILFTLLNTIEDKKNKNKDIDLKTISSLSPPLPVAVETNVPPKEEEPCFVETSVVEKQVEDNTKNIKPYHHRKIVKYCRNSATAPILDSPTSDGWELKEVAPGVMGYALTNTFNAYKERIAKEGFDTVYAELENNLADKVKKGKRTVWKKSEITEYDITSFMAFKAYEQFDKERTFKWYNMCNFGVLDALDCICRCAGLVMKDWVKWETFYLLSNNRNQISTIVTFFTNWMAFYGQRYVDSTCPVLDIFQFRHLILDYMISTREKWYALGRKQFYIEQIDNFHSFEYNLHRVTERFGIGTDEYVEKVVKGEIPLFMEMDDNKVQVEFNSAYKWQKQQEKDPIDDYCPQSIMEVNGRMYGMDEKQYERFEEAMATVFDKLAFKPFSFQDIGGESFEMDFSGQSSQNVDNMKVEKLKYAIYEKFYCKEVADYMCN